MSVSSYYDKIKGELTYFGKNAVADVGRIMTLVQGLKISEREVMKVVQDIYITHFQEVNGVDANKAHQSWVAASGNNFEDFIATSLMTTLTPKG